MAEHVSIAFLRGVNVAGVTVKMAELRSALSDSGLANVRTVLASGNVLFDEDGTKPATRKAQIEGCLRDTFGYDAWIVLFTATELTRIVDGFPFVRDDPAVQPYVVLGSAQAALEDLHTSAPKLDPAVEAIELTTGALYWRVPKGSTLDTPFAKLLAHKRFRATTTNRNLRTLNKVLAAAG
jgi:uncharacterized protein (DUF1697 family)